MNAQRKCRWSLAIAIAVSLFCAHTATGQTFSSGSTGADGPLNHTAGGTTTLTVNATGIYNFTTVNVAANTTLRFVRNAANTPVVILATGDVTIAGSLVLSGLDNIGNPSGTQPIVGTDGGPGGFAGGNGTVSGGVPPTAGKGPAGGAPASGSGGNGGSYGAPASFVSLIPLFGGSGGGGGGFNFIGGGPGASGAGGGGAILIASSTRINITGQVRANGGADTFSGSTVNASGGPGSGGAIRLVAPEITGTGALLAVGGTGANAALPSDGRIRLEAFTVGFNGTTAPTPSIANAPGPVSPAGNPALASVPTLAIASVGGVAVPSVIAASYFAPDMALAPGTVNPVPVVLTATNTPVGAPTEITLRMIPQSPGTATNIAVPAVDHTGTFASSTASANVTLPVGQVTVMQAFAGMTLTGQTASLFPLIDGEPVARVLVAANQGLPSTVSLVSRTGKEIRVEQLPAEDQLRVARAWAILKETRIE